MSTTTVAPTVATVVYDRLKIGDIVALHAQGDCDDSHHTGQNYDDVLTTLFILAWVQVVPAVLAIIQYFSSFFAKKRKVICCNEKWKKAKIEAEELTQVETVSEYRERKGKRKRSNGRMCCVVFLRNASIFLNYLIVFSAFIAGIMVIYVYLVENDRDVENLKNTFYTFRAAAIFHLILAILGIFYVIFMPCVMYYSPLPQRGVTVILFNARLNLQLLIYFLSVMWFIIFFVSAYLEYFYTWDDCGYEIYHFIDRL